MILLSKPYLRLLTALGAAVVAIVLEPSVSGFVHRSPGALPALMVLLLAGMLTPPIREELIITLCFCIALLAAGDGFNAPRAEYAAGWAMLCLLAVVAGTVESLRPGSIWTRRCYFAAAAVYTGGHGVMAYESGPSGEGLVLMATAFVATLGVVFADRITAPEAIPEQQPDPEVRPEARVQRVAAHEWKE